VRLFACISTNFCTKRATRRHVVWVARRDGRAREFRVRIGARILLTRYCTTLQSSLTDNPRHLHHPKARAPPSSKVNNFLRPTLRSTLSLYRVLRARTSLRDLRSLRRVQMNASAHMTRTTETTLRSDLTRSRGWSLTPIWVGHSTEV
jgi:hypothetical protein